MKIKKKDIIYISIIATLIVILAVFIILKANKQISYYNKKCDSFATQNANLSTGQIIFIGDSITDLYPLDDYYSDLELATYNRGIGGDTTTGVLKRLDVSLYDLKPSKIVLMIGTNDINGRKDSKQIIDNYDLILSSIHDNLPDTKVFCMSVIPQNKDINKYSKIDYDQSNQLIIELNKEIEKNAYKYSYQYIDLFSLLIDENNSLIALYSDDGLHLNKNGFEVWTNLLKPYLKEEK